MRCRKGFKNVNISNLFKLYAYTVAGMRLHISKKNNPLLKYMQSLISLGLHSPDGNDSEIIL